MVELFEQDIRTNDRQSSKGNQLKWKNESMWYKADYAGYEGLAEYVVSHLLQKSTLSADEFVLYDLEKIKYKATSYNGVKSADFLNEGWQLITLERLFKINYGKSLYETIYKISDYEERMQFLVEQVIKITGLLDFGKYVNKIFTIDAFFLNEDRHTHNIAVLMSAEGKFAYAPIFDNGAGLMSDTTMDYPLGIDVYEQMKYPKAKTICSDFDEQLDVSEKLYGKNIKFNFVKKDVESLMEDVDAYPKDVKLRVANVIYAQMSKYQYLFE